MEEPWPFDQPRNCAAVSLRSIVQGGVPVLLVIHNADDHSWQFMTGGPVRMEDAVLVAMSTVVDRDATLYEVADIPPGWEATRPAVGEAWHRSRSPAEADV
jgi:hypothetical protein